MNETLRCLLWWGGGGGVGGMMLNEKVASKVIDSSAENRKGTAIERGKECVCVVWIFNAKLWIRFSFIRFFFFFSPSSRDLCTFFVFAIFHTLSLTVAFSSFILLCLLLSTRAKIVEIAIIYVYMYISYVPFTCLPSNLTYLLTYIHTHTCSLACIFKY